MSLTDHFSRLLIAMLVGLLLVVGLVFFYLLPAFEKNAMRSKKEMLKALVQVAYKEVEAQYNKVQTGEWSEEKAKEEALEELREFTWGPESDDYFWVNDLNCVMVMHPYRKELKGQNLKEYQDSEGNYLFQDMVKTVRETGSGFVEYVWQYKDEIDREGHKLSYVRLFEPWGWVIGTGTYYDDIQRDTASLKKQVFSIAGLTLFLLVLAYLYSLRQGYKIEQQRREKKKELMISESRMRAVLEAVPDLIVCMRENGSVQSFHQAREPIQFLRELREDCEFTKLFPEDVAEKIQRGVAILQSGSPVSVIECSLMRDGIPNILEMRMTSASQGVFVFLIRDVTDEYNSQEELALSKEAAESANRAKSAFLANMSHEIRTPLNGILGYVDLMMEECDQCDCNRGRLGIVHNCTRSLIAIINDVLDLSKIEAGRLDLNESVFMPEEILREPVDLVLLHLREKGIRLTSDFRDLPKYLKGDPVRLRQIVLNLLWNAVKFTDAGEIALSVSATEDGDKVTLMVSVKDTGIGIPADKLDKIFEPFERGETGSSRSGSGLGLPLAKKMIEMMNGRIEVESEEGKGSCFFFSIELKHAEGEDISPVKDRATDREARTNMKVLIVEDNPVNQRLAALLVERLGNTAVTASGGEQAIRLTQGGEFDVILMDVRMPGIDGIETTRRLRAAGVNIPIIALTAGAMEGTREKCLEEGMDDYLSKPITAEDMHLAFCRCCPQSRFDA